MLRRPFARFDRSPVRRATSLVPALLLCALAGCSEAPDPVTHVGGPTGSIAGIAGEWSGDYRLSDGSRRGDITFSLAPGDSIASGRVIMRPPTEVEMGSVGETAPTPQPNSTIQPLDVSFVAVDNNVVRGTLQKYVDPDCSCDVQTTFEGTLKGDLIDGTFTIKSLVDGRSRTGRWSVRRQASQ
ncbi:MAG: hypothetical protein ACREOU_03890 [Candidatus Eiseniibacteriota bacterium]